MGTEADTCRKFVVPKLQSAGWDTDPHSIAEQRTITDGSRSAEARSAQIETVTRLDGRLILHGGESGRGWAATISEATGRMSAGVVGDEYTFAMFGVCTTP